ncbi:hypothetical protein H0H81_009826 [Sphagnurus paluster]|uniref:F-box domain-containing protein n=1 Tax=Sphagnurus paluster TaxID=117069 RepID=A0A9P7FTC6_9AGAR|nr:hypothetical protein H0H81_009826 [Sphagnurus paluster]
MTPDLPVELWLEILSMLPAHSVRKMMGISRILFEMAMDDIYQELHFESDGDQMLRTFQQLQYPNLARRVQHFYIRPNFLPGAEVCGRAERISKKFLCIPIGSSTRYESPPSRKSLQQSISTLEFAKGTISHLLNVQAVTIVLHDLAVTPVPSFVPFLHVLFSSLGHNLRKLTLNLTLPKLPIVLDSKISRELHALVDLEVILANSRFTAKESIKDTLVPFTRSLAGTLESLSISTLMMVDLNPFFDGVGYLPKLRKFVLIFELSFVVFQSPAPAASYVARFISRHQEILQHLTVRIQHPHFFPFHEESWMQTYSVNLKLPHLRTLELGVLARAYDARFPLDWRKNVQHLPSLSQLENLIIFNTTLSIEDVEALLEALHHSKSCDILQRLSMKITILNSRLVDLLASRLPSLTYLELTFGEYLRTEYHIDMVAFRREMEPRILDQM